MLVCIYAAASDNIDSKYIKDVEYLGKELAKDGNTLIYGAGSTGLMGAAARGFRAEDGIVIGVTPKFMKDIEPIFEDCTLIYTDTMAERKKIMETETDAFLIAPGGVGTMDEFFQCVTLKDLGQLNKPIIIYNPDNYYTKMIEFLDDCIEKGFIKERVRDFCDVVATPEEAVKVVNKYNELMKDNKTLIGDELYNNLSENKSPIPTKTTPKMNESNELFEL